MVAVYLKDILLGRTYPEGGTALYDYIKDAIIKDQPLMIDMEGVDAVPTMFMNTSFGDSIDNYGIEKTKSVLKFKNISKSQIERISKYFTDYASIINKRNDI